MDLSKEELRRIRKLREESDHHRGSKEKQKRTDNEHVGWMYKDAKETVDREEYLLGKRIGREVEDDFKEEEHEIERVLPVVDGAVEDEGPALTVDLAAKIREDPLFQIKRQEEDNKRALLKNPVKMKQLKEMVERQRQEAAGDGKKRKKGKKKKKEKRKKMSRKKDSSSDSSDSEGDDLLERYQAVLAKMKSKKRSASPPVPLQTKERRSDGSGGGGGGEASSSDSDDCGRKRKKKHYGLYVPDGAVPRRRHDHQNTTSTEVKPSNGVEKQPARRDPRNVKKMSAAEKERRLKEMMSDAVSRDKEREERCSRHQREVEREESRYREGRGGGGRADNRPVTMSHSATVEDSIRRRMNNVQRTSAALDKHFTKR